MPISSRSTAAVDSRSSHIAARSRVASESASAQSRAACAAGPTDPSIDNGSPTTRPPAPSLLAIAAISAALSRSLPRFRLP